MKDQVLWERIQTFPMPLDFAERLARNTGWPRDRAEAAIVEYKRLAYLTALVKTARRVPSKQVEAVWDLHIADTDSYARFTGEVMGRRWTRPRGGFAQRDGRDAVATRRAYLREFKTPPPRRHWPDPNRGLRLGIAGAFAVAGLAGSLAAGSFGPGLAGGAVALILLLAPWRTGGQGDDGSAAFGAIIAGDGGFDGGGDGGGGCD